MILGLLRFARNDYPYNLISVSELTEQDKTDCHCEPTKEGEATPRVILPNLLHHHLNHHLINLHILRSATIKIMCQIDICSQCLGSNV
jgi:hypothetical protein